MSRRALGILFAVSLVLPVVGASADDPRRLPIYEPAFLEPIPAGRCAPEGRFDQADYYGEKCERLRFVFGPILAKSGQNDVLIQPTSFEKPAYDGYIVRMRPDLIDATGVVPPVDQLHLHHGTWLNVNRSYGSGPWMASGEEKTTLVLPRGYGIKVLASDLWLLLHMVHNATALPRVVYVTYDIDFVKAADADGADPVTGRTPMISNTRQIWLDVGGGKFHPETDTYTANPVFNLQKGFGQTDPGAFGGYTFQAPDPRVYPGRLCTWPKENCARFNSEGNVSAQQGKEVVVAGKDYLIGDAALGVGVEEGTLIVIGGHVHPGGIRDEVSLVRGAVKDPNNQFAYVGGVEKPIHISDAFYWKWDDPATADDESLAAGAPPTSWDFSMTGTGELLGWKVHVKRGDVLRLNGVYDTEIGSWYEQMGIVMTWVNPGDTSGVDVFSPNTVLHPGFPTTAPLPEGVTATCSPGFDAATGKTTLCLRGTVTHGHIETSGNHGLCLGCRDLTSKVGPLLTDIPIEGFTYGPADLGIVGAAGIPQVKVGQKVTFWNEDAAAYIWHTVTRCSEPCNGKTTTDYPLSDAALGPSDTMDFDSSELGYGLAPAQRIEWEFVPDRTGVFTFYCRIHPQMRGAIKVVD